MLMTELTLATAVVALLVALVNSLMIFWWRRDTHRQISEFRQEMKANLSAGYGMARHLRIVHSKVLEGGAGSRPTASFQDAVRMVEDGADTELLADRLGVSRTEAEIITHLKPRKSHLRESA